MPSDELDATVAAAGQGGGLCAGPLQEGKSWKQSVLPRHRCRVAS